MTRKVQITYNPPDSTRPYNDPSVHTLLYSSVQGDPETHEMTRLFVMAGRKAHMAANNVFKVRNAYARTSSSMLKAHLPHSVSTSLGSLLKAGIFPILYSNVVIIWSSDFVQELELLGFACPGGMKVIILYIYMTCTAFLGGQCDAVGAVLA